MKEFLPGYIRQTEEIAKDKLLADRAAELTVNEVATPMSGQMAKCGITVVQDETFYVEPKKEESV